MSGGVLRMSRALFAYDLAWLSRGLSLTTAVLKHN
ncbi:hypothetical protein C8E00_10530 [Chromohalobacter marismortui]|uniref:Uncharacterized protein n=1 Tax=Chromohalobacter marismortui TaxID=42055 RepID=A0A4V3F3K5_9GAMM|nr:hypothetical protein C8E00_10530 [Chromohalobacter marismortui]